MKIDFKVVFLILAVFCQLYYVEGWWGGGGRRSSSGSRSRTPSVRTSSRRRGGFWSRRRTPSIRKPSVSRRRGGFWSRRRTPSIRKPSVSSPLKVSKGQITFDAEGNDNPNSKYFSRKAHVPSSSSGITLGRGYDLKQKTKSQVYNDLRQSGVPKATAKKFSEGVRLSGQAAKDYIKNNKLQGFTLTHKQQKQLFTKTYSLIASDAKRLATKPDVVKKYGKTNWDQLNRTIKDVVVDLRYRGDYTPTTRKKIQSAIAKNDFKKFRKLMSDRDYWVNKRRVPKDRFERRKKALDEAAKKG